MDAEKRNAIFTQYINQHKPVIDQTLSALKKNPTDLLIPYAQFLFSIIDYYGILYRTAKENEFKKFIKDNFLDFFSSKYFPKAVYCKKDLIYFIRNGIMHQLFPKATGICYDESFDLFLKNKGNTPILNVRYLDEITRDAICAFEQELKTNDQYIDTLYDHLILSNYALNDHKEFKKIIDDSLGGDLNNIFIDCK